MQEAKQALQLMHKWETIDVCDALELLSPVFESEEVVPLIFLKKSIFSLFTLVMIVTLFLFHMHVHRAFKAQSASNRGLKC